MSYLVYLKKSAEKELDSIQKEDRERIVKGTKKLHGHKGYRIKVGNYRVLFEVYDSIKKIEIFSIVHRKDAYR